MVDASGVPRSTGQLLGRPHSQLSTLMSSSPTLGLRSGTGSRDEQGLGFKGLGYRGLSLALAPGMILLLSGSASGFLDTVCSYE